MKTRILKGLIVVLASCTLIGGLVCLTSAASASEYTVRTSGNRSLYCSVHEARDIYELDYSVRRYANYFNRPDSSQGCRERINFNAKKMGKKTIRLKKAIRLYNDDNASEESWFVFGPADQGTVSEVDAEADEESEEESEESTGDLQEDDRIGFSIPQDGFTIVSTIEESDSGEAEAEAETEAGTEDSETGTSEQEPYDAGRCAISIESDYTVVQNISINGNGNRVDGKKMHGLCINAMHVRIKNVRISGMSGSGVRLGPIADDIRFEGMINKVSNSFYGVEIMPRPGEGNQIGRVIDIPYISERSEEDAPADGNVDTGGAKIGFYGNTEGRNIKSPIALYVSDEQLKITGDGNYTILGQVVSCDIKEDPSCGCQGENFEKVLIFAQPKDSAPVDTDPFVKECEPFSRASTDSNTKGKFRCRFTEAQLNDKNLSKEIFIIPVSMGSDLGSSTKLFTLQAQEGANACVAADISDGNNTEHLNEALFGDVGDCNEIVGLWDVFTNYDLDTDGDGLMDIVEMSIRLKDNKVYVVDAPTCDTESAASKWTHADSDGDGIVDQIELRCGGVDGDALIGSQRQLFEDPPVLCNIPGRIALDSENADIVWYEIGTIKDVFGDPDNDNLPNSRDADSDGDGQNDGFEDRAKFFRGRGASQRVAYLEYIQPVGDQRFLLGNERQVCYRPSGSGSGDDVKGDSVGSGVYTHNPELGVSYGVYVIDKVNKQVLPYTEDSINDLTSTAEAAAEDGGEAEVRYEVKALKCQATGLDDGHSFNNKFDGGDCSDLHDSGSKECVKTCFEGEAVRAIDDPNHKYVNEDNNGMTRGDSMALLFEDVLNGEISAESLRTICGDFDMDGIPNCVEAAAASNDYLNIGGCPNPANSVTNLPAGQRAAAGHEYAWNPYTKDSDGDGLNEGWFQNDDPDKCPTTNGATDNADLNDEADEGSISCGISAYSLYRSEGSELLSFFLDRDNDTFRDIDEYIVDKALLADKNSDAYKTALRSALSAAKDKPRTGRGYLVPTDPLRSDTEDDGLSDWLETMQLHTMPGFNDSDEDGLTDFEEVSRDGDPATGGDSGEYAVVTHDTCGSTGYDTNPKERDTDGDGLTDFEEVMFLKTSPNDIDSDGDGLCDGPRQETGVCASMGFELWRSPVAALDLLNGNEGLQRYETNPCSQDTDGDNDDDGDEFSRFGCGNDRDANCIGYDPELIGEFSERNDTDHDGLPDIKEIEFGTDPEKEDTDGDGLVDGCHPTMHIGELCNLERDDYAATMDTYFYNCTPPDFIDCDTNPGRMGSTPAPGTPEEQLLGIPGYDTDGDGISDKKERTYPMNPWNFDTDGDCIPDGPMVLADGTVSLGEDKNRNGHKDSNETIAASAETEQGGRIDQFMAIDTDGDMVPDGCHEAYPELLCEDRNCNGRWDSDSESNPLSWNTDGDAWSDGDEYRRNGGVPSWANLGEVLTGKTKGGCSMALGAGADWSIIVMFAGLILIVGRMRRRKTLNTTH